MRKKIFSVIIASCAIIVSSASLHGQDTQVDSSLNNTTNDTGTNVSGDAEVITKSKRSSDAIIITGRRYESSVLKEGKAVTVITEEEIKASGKSSLVDVLNSVPGITVSRDGTDVGSANIFMRGSKSGNVLIMIDGVKINDPSGIGKTVDLSLIKTVNIERIEIVEGSMSSLYGAEASGGVINIITKKADGNQVSVKFNGGMYDSYSQSVSVSESFGKGAFFFSGAHFSSGGISTAKDMSETGNFDDDAVENYIISCKMTGELWEKTLLVFNMNYSDKEMDIDMGEGLDDPDDRSSSKLFTTAGEFRHTPLSWWNYKAGVSFMSIDRVYISPDVAVTGKSSSVLQGAGIHGAVLNNFIIPVIGTISVGVEAMNETANTSSAYYDWDTSTTVISYIQDRGVTTLSAFIHDAYSFNDYIFLNAGARIDDHNEFGTHYTWDASGAFILPATKTKLRGSVGTGFKAPSIYELYDTQSGNTDLDPEKSFVYDAGIYQEISLGENLFTLECTYFYQRYTDMLSYIVISWSPFKSQAVNLDGEMADRGVELAASFKLSSLLSLRYAYTYLDFLESTDNQHLLKRPGHKHFAILNVTPGYGLGINLSYLYMGSRWGKQTVKMDPYHKIDANIRYAFNKMLTVTVRGENLTDADYMDTYGYNTYGRSFFGGIELTF